MISDDVPLDSQPAKVIRTRSTSMSDSSTIPAKAKQDEDPNLPVGRKSVLARAELWDRRISVTENESNPPPLSVDIEQWANEFEKIQNDS